MNIYDGYKDEDYRQAIQSLEHELKTATNAIGDVWYAAYKAPELNMNNYNSDDVDKLNDAMTAVFKIVDEVSE